MTRDAPFNRKNDLLGFTASPKRVSFRMDSKRTGGTFVEFVCWTRFLFNLALVRLIDPLSGFLVFERMFLYNL